MLDLFSILVVFLIVIVISGITLFVVKWQYGKEYSGLNEWFYGFSCMGIGVFIIVFLDRIPYIAGMLVSNYLIMIGLVMLYMGIVHFFNQKVHYKRQVTILATAFGLYLVFTFINNSLVLRNIVFTGVIITVLIQSLIVFHGKSKEDYFGVHWSRTIFLLALIASIGRIVSLVYAPQNVEHYHNYTTNFEIGTIIAYLSLTLLLLLSFLLLLVSRLIGDTLKAENKFKESFRLSPDGLILYRLHDGKVVEVNASFLKMAEITHDKLMANPVWSLKRFDESTKKVLKKRPDTFQAETKWTFESTKGEKHVLVRSSLIQVDGTAHRLVSFEDITAVINLQKTYEKMASHDMLTDLPNRRHFEHHFEKNKASKKSFALALGDIDNFKEINDAYGHDVGDEVLKAFASRIKSTLKKEDLVARFGGDEFVLLLDSVNSDSDTEAMFQAIIDALKAPLKVNGETIEISMSFGVVYAKKTKDLKHLLKIADDAMYQAKKEKVFFVLKSPESKSNSIQRIN